MTRRSADCHNPPPAMSPVIGLFSNRPPHQPFPPMGGYRPTRVQLTFRPRRADTPSVTASKGGDARVEGPPTHGVARLDGGVHHGRGQQLEELLSHTPARAPGTAAMLPHEGGSIGRFSGTFRFQPASSGSRAGSASATRSRSGVPATLGREVAGSCSPIRTRSRLGISSLCAPAP